MDFIKLSILACLLLYPLLAKSQDCFDTSIKEPTPFMGKDGEIVKLDDGSFWRIENANENLYAYYPSVIICPALEKLIIGEKTLDANSLASKASTEEKISEKDLPASIVASHVNGEFEGWNGKTIVKLTNGQVWQQNQYYYQKYYAYMPKVFIFISNGQHRMKVNGINKSVGVKLLE